MAKDHDHWVPRFYLKHFAKPGTKDAENPRIYAYSPSENRPFETGTRQVAAEKGLYGVQGADDLLREVEDYVAPMWDQLATKKVRYSNSSIRGCFAFFIATLYARNRSRLDSLKETGQRLRDALESMPKDHRGFPLVNRIETKDGVLEVDPESFGEFKTPNDDIEREMFAYMTIELTPQVWKILMQKKWTMILATDSAYMTSDNPVLLRNPQIGRFGFVTKGTQFLLPVSPDRLLMIHEEDALLDGEYYSIHSQENVLHPKNINEGLIDTCIQQVFSDRPSEESCADLDSTTFQRPETPRT